MGKPSPEIEPTIQELVDSPHYFEQEIQNLIQRAEVYQIQRFMIPTTRPKAFKIARIAAERFYQALIQGAPE